MGPSNNNIRIDYTWLFQEYKNKYILDPNEDTKHSASRVVVFATNKLSGCIRINVLRSSSGILRV